MSVGAAVVDDSEAVLSEALKTGDLRYRELDPAEKFLFTVGESEQRRNVFFRGDDDMHRHLRRDIPESDAILVLVNDRGRYFAFNGGAKSDESGYRGQHPVNFRNVPASRLRHIRTSAAASLADRRGSFDELSAIYSGRDGAA